MSGRRRYTRTEKAHAVGLAVVSGTTAAAEQVGVPESTLRYWMDAPEFAALREKTRDQVADELWTAIQVGVREVALGLRGDASLRDKATALGILYDKHALLTGGATARTEARELASQLGDGDLVEALREFERLASPDRAAEAAAGTPAE